MNEIKLSIIYSALVLFFLLIIEIGSISPVKELRTCEVKEVLELNGYFDKFQTRIKFEDGFVLTANGKLGEPGETIKYPRTVGSKSLFNVIKFD